MEIAQKIADLKERGEGVFKSDHCEFSLFSALFSREIEVYIFLDQPFDLGISDRQISLLEAFFALDESALNLVKARLFEHWDNGSDYWEFDIDVDGPEDAYQRSSDPGLFLVSKNRGLKFLILKCLMLHCLICLFLLLDHSNLKCRLLNLLFLIL